MITEDQKTAYKKVLGHRYTAKVRETLKGEGVTDNSGKTHSSKMITQVFNGETSHALIEDAILKTVKEILAIQKKDKARRKKLLKSIID